VAERDNTGESRFIMEMVVMVMMTSVHVYVVDDGRIFV